MRPNHPNPKTHPQPILVTGAHRSGTTWVGKMLIASGEAAYIREPLNLVHLPGILDNTADYWYTFINEKNQVRYLQAFRHVIQFQYHTYANIKSLRTPKDLLVMVRKWSIFYLARLRNQRPLLKDPFAVFSAPWFNRVLNCQVVIVVRHPAAFASSLKRLNWPFDFDHFMAQPLLMEDLLEPYRHEMMEMNRFPDDVIGHSSLLWKIIYQVVAQYESRYPQFLVVRHEDLSLNPQETFRKIYNTLGLRFNNRARKIIEKASSPENPPERADQTIYTTHLNSRANLDNWRHRLTYEEITRIHNITKDIASLYYSEESWS